MEYAKILKILAPRVLNCAKCIGFADGDIKKQAGDIKKLLGSFDSYAERFSHFLPVFKNYPSFKELLDHFAQADCNGCRKGDCKYPNCGVASCYKQKGVDFCFQCEEFPCNKTKLDPNLNERWIKGNTLMKQKGINPSCSTRVLESR
ncbi:MAG: DUF3795 domain-containing protein [Thermodesulfovibrionales bacterium]